MGKKKVETSPVVKKVVPAKEKGMSFPEALKALIGGAKIRRIEWADQSEYGLLRDAFLMIHRNNTFHTWLVSEGDMMALDWVVTK